MLQNIITASAKINWSAQENLEQSRIIYGIPEHESRGGEIKSCTLRVGDLKDFVFLPQDLILIDAAVKQYTFGDNLSGKHTHYLVSDERTLKTVKEANKLVELFMGQQFDRVISIGGGLVLNVARYVAEQLNLPTVEFPTTIIAMSDASIGGKVRLNGENNGAFVKHAYKATHQPNEVVVDTQFIEHIADDRVRVGLAEIIKHALYQSDGLLNYLLSDAFDPFKNKESLLRAILWTADLKRICAEVDPMESKDGARMIVKAAHDVSDKLEEESNFALSHGEAVEQAMLLDLVAKPEKLSKLEALYKKLGIVLVQKK